MRKTRVRTRSAFASGHYRRCRVESSLRRVVRHTINAMIVFTSATAKPVSPVAYAVPSPIGVVDASNKGNINALCTACTITAGHTLRERQRNHAHT